MNKKLLEIAKKFCTDDDTPHCKTPWNANGKTYATNCRIAVEIDGEHGESMSPEIKYPNLGKNVFSTIPPLTIAIPAEMPKIEIVQCSTCSGGGKVNECAACDGEGLCECDCGDRHDCHKCDGLGHIAEDTGDDPCPDCDGTGKDHRDQFPVDIGPFHLLARYLILAKSLPGAKSFRYSDNKSPVIVEFKDGRAAIMPYRMG